MVRYFTHYWANKTWRYMELLLNSRAEGLLMRAGSNRFIPMGVKKDDYVYIFTIKKGKLFLGGRILVAKVLTHSQALDYRDWRYPIWKADHHVVASESSAEKFTPDNEISIDIVKQLRFKTSKGLAGLKFEAEGVLDRQTLRGVRQLTSSSASLLDQFLKYNTSIH